MVPEFIAALVFYCFSLTVAIQLFYYIFFFSRLAFYHAKEKTISQTHPVSVIICARDEAANLVKNLPGALVQHYKTTHEVIVINDNSFDESKYVLDEYRKSFKHLNIVELKQEARFIPGKKFPLSVGIKEAKYEVLLMTDADCVPASEFWIEKMQEGYQENTEIVLGYGALHKRKGFLNKLIRWETFHTALQYLSYAVAGLPYMGVGRNLSYKKSVFFRHKGFSSHNHVASGDDDLFINLAANKKNTAIVVDKEAFTLSAAPSSWKEWMRQKSRHYSTSRYYKSLHKFLLGMYALSHGLLYPLFAATIIFYNWKWALAIFGIRFLMQFFVFYKTMNRLNEKDLLPIFWLLDIWMFFYYILFSFSMIKKPRKTWK
jgi:cellulose synthase/poly-beta-1,6-N-acetylglucosamine synthase-like glycosyltransferase